jgi:hypothetical protein
MKSKDQQLLEEAYDEVVQKMLAGSNNPGFDPENPWFSGQAFKPWAPKGGWSKKTSAAKPKAVKKAKEVEPEEDDELDVEGDPVGSYRSIATPEPEIETKVVSIPFELLDDIQTKDSELYTIITGVAKKVEQNGDNLNFTYSADKAADIEFFIQNYK